MNRAEFMRRLTELLGDVAPTEREEAIQYYNDYFDDAGEENESGVIASLGTPEELARTIKAGLNDGGNGGEFTESGFSGYTQTPKDEIVKVQDGDAAGRTDSSAGPAHSRETAFMKELIINGRRVTACMAAGRIREITGILMKSPAHRRIHPMSSQEAMAQVHLTDRGKPLRSRCQAV